MILSEVIQHSAAWDSVGYHCTDAEQYRRFYRFLRQAILDRHIPQSKVIGVSYIKSDKSIKRLKSFVNIEGNDSVGESFPELMLNLQDKIFLPTQAPSRTLKQYSCTLPTGVHTIMDSKIQDAEQRAVPVLYTKPDMCTVMNDSVIIELHIYYGCKYMDMSATSHLLTKNVFPFYVDYSLQDYIRILPRRPEDTDNTIKIRMYNGMTKDLFIQLLYDWETALSNIDFGTEEKLWLQRSEH